jgi:hypothetical protein
MLVDVYRSFFFFSAFRSLGVSCLQGACFLFTWPVSCPGHQLLFEHHRTEEVSP